tara:strand:- start:68 stop:724 length:657 start_codon:yes stop_codon:yes gene_type:complete
MNINEYKKYLQNVHGTLDDDPGIKQVSARLRKEAYPSDMEEYKPDKKEDKSTVAPTTAAGDSLRPGSKSAEKMEKIKEELALEYFDSYFGDELTEDTSDEDIIQAVYDLIELRDAVCEAVGLESKKNLTVDEAFPREVSTPIGDLTAEPASKKGYLRPTPKQLKTALAKQAELKDPVLIVKGRDEFGGHVQQKKITGQDIRNKARDKRIKRMKKFKMK